MMAMRRTDSGVTMPTPFQAYMQKQMERLDNALFKNIPHEFSLRKKIYLSILNSRFLVHWQGFLAFLSLFASICYICETYFRDLYIATQFFKQEDAVVSVIFTCDWVANLVAAPIKLHFFLDVFNCMDVATFLPFWVLVVKEAQKNQSTSVNLGILRFLRILRLLRFVRMFKSVSGKSGASTKMIQIIFTVLTLIFVGAGVLQLFENDVRQAMEYNCDYINPYTNWLPSCCDTLPYAECNAIMSGRASPTASSSVVSRRLQKFALVAPNVCDCVDQNCYPSYNYYDNDGQPSSVQCDRLSFFDCVYFLVVTVATLGYGDIAPQTDLSRLVTMVIIILSVVLIPTQVNQLATILAMSSPFRTPYIKRSATEIHIIICGSINDRAKLERFLNEFFHPSRVHSRDRDIRVILFGYTEPNDDIKDFLVNSAYGKNCQYVIGSALSIEDLHRVEANNARAVFFFCSSVARDGEAEVDDSANILRALSITNFNPSLRCYAQVLRNEDRDILQSNDVDVVLCADEFRSSIMARNAVCPGLSTIIENLFHTADYENDPLALPWKSDYRRGADMEIYYIPLPTVFLQRFGFNWRLMAEAVFTEFDALLIGVCTTDDTTSSVILNPTALELGSTDEVEAFYAEKYRTAIILAGDQDSANGIARGLAEHAVLDNVVARMCEAEAAFRVRTSGNSVGTAAPGAGPIHDKKSSHGHHNVAHTSIEDLIHGDNDIATRQLAQLQQGLAHTTRRQEATSSKAGKEEGDFKGFVESSVDESGGEEDSLLGAESRVAQMMSKLSQIARNSGSGGGSGGGTPSGVPSLNIAEARTPSVDPEEQTTFLKQFMAPGSSGAASSSEEKHLAATSGTVAVGPPRALPSLAHPSTVGGGAVVARAEQRFGQPCSVIDSATHLRRHVVAIGSGKNFDVFVTELRRPLISAYQHHPIVYVGTTEPENWPRICRTFVDVFWLKGSISRATDFNRSNVRDALSVVLITDRETLSRVDDETCDAVTLFSYLKLSKHIGKNVFFATELALESNMVVLNKNIVQRLWRAAKDGGKEEQKRGESFLSVRGRRGFYTHEEEKARREVEKASKKSKRSASMLFSLAPMAAARVEHSPGGKDDDESPPPVGFLRKQTSNLSESSAEGSGSDDALTRGVSMSRMPLLSKRVSSSNLFRGASASTAATADEVTASSSSESDSDGNARARIKPSPAARMGGSRQSSLHAVAEGADDASLGSGSGSGSSGKKRVQISESLPHATNSPRLSEEPRPLSARSFVSSRPPSPRADAPGGAMMAKVHLDTELHELPVFASGQGFVPSTIDAIIANSFFDRYTPLICERLVCGQDRQTTYQIPVPTPFHGRPFMDAFRAFLSRGVAVLAVYRAPTAEDGALLPYVCTCPRSDMMLRENDKFFVYCNPMVLDHALKTALTRTLLTTVSTAGEQRAALNQFDGYDAHLFTRPYNAVI